MTATVLLTVFFSHLQPMPDVAPVSLAIVEEFDIVPKTKEKTVSEEPVKEEEKGSFFDRFKKFGADKEEEQESSLLKTSAPDGTDSP